MGFYYYDVLLRAFVSNFVIVHYKENMNSYFEEKAPCCEPHFWVLLTMCSGFLLFAATTSGLALGLMSFSQVDLEVLVLAGQPHIQKHAGR